MQMVCNLREFKEFIDNEMIVILGQMDSPTQIFEHVFLVSLGPLYLFFKIYLATPAACVNSWARD